MQSEKLTIEDPEFRSAVDDAADRLSRTRHVTNVASPLGGPGEVSADGHTALVEFEVTGDALEAAKRLDAAEKAVAEVQRAHPGLLVEQFGSVSSNKQLSETFSSDLLKAETLSFPLTLRSWSSSRRSRTTLPVRWPRVATVDGRWMPATAGRTNKGQAHRTTPSGV